MSDSRYLAANVVEAEGARIAIVTCKECGAALVLDREVNVMEVHDEFHNMLEARWDDYLTHDKEER